MGFTNPARLRIASLAIATVITGSVLVAVSPAAADTAPAVPTTPDTVSSDALPTVQINGVVWDQKIVGNTVYAGGEFTSAQPAGAAAGVNTVPRSNLLAYNLQTGVLISSFAPTFNGAVKSVTASPDGARLYVGGSFTQVNGQNRYRIAAFDTATGSLVAGFAPAFNSTIETVEATNTVVYAGGNFTSVGSSQRVRAAAVRATNGAVLPFAPVADGGRVRAIAISPDESKIILGGAFTTLNGSGNPGYGLGAVSAADASLLPWAANDYYIRNAGENASIFSLTSDGDSVYGTGYHFGAGGTLEGTFRANWSDGNVVWVEDCHGDTYSAAVTSDVVYTASHAHYCGNSGGFPQTSPTWTIQRAMAWSKAPTTEYNKPDPYGYFSFNGVVHPELLNWWPDINIGSFTGANQGAWSVAANEDYVVYGGEFTVVNNKRQQGLVRFATRAIAPNADGPRLTGADYVPNAVSLASGTVRLSWLANYDRDNQYLKYELIRDNDQANPIHIETKGSRIWFDRPTMGYLDKGLAPGSTHTYRLRVTDPLGNSRLGNTVSVTVSADGQASAYANGVLDDGAKSFWRLGESGGPAVYDWAGFSDATAASGVSFGATGAISGDSNRAATFSGDGNGFVATQTPIQGPDTFAIEAWFKTTSTGGGKIVGFGNSNTGNSSSYDRHIFMDNSGRVVFGVYPGTSRTIESAPGLNDGQWHQVVANLGPTGMQLFVDGTRVAQRSDTTFGQAYSGYWRIGGDSSWAANNYFAGAIDDVAIYDTPLTVQTVNRHLTLSGRQSTLPTAPADSYGAAVFADEPDIYWRLDESSGETAADISGGGDTGLYSGGVTKGAPGAISGTSNAAAAFDGSSGLVSSTRQYSNPQSYSLELWFNSTSNAGGKLIGFGRSQTGLSGSYDRHVYLEDSGRIVFGTYTGQLNTITTPGSYTDGQWHHVVATQSGAGLRLYVDGQLSGSNPTTAAEGYDGYWRIGGDNTWGSSSAYVNARIDEAAVYPGALSASDVAEHYALGAGAVANVAPTASFTSTTSGLDVSVDGTGSSDSDGSIASWSWDFGDGGTATGRTASHTYVSAGTRTVTLTVTDDDGATATTTRQVTTVAQNVAPVAAFSTTVSGLTLTADASASSDSDGTIASYRWNFGDTQTATTAVASHAYAAAGSYTVTLTVTDNVGATDVISQVVTVAPPANQAPVASFTSTTTGLGVSVDGSTSADADGTIASWSWAFGDGGTAVGATASHTYPTAGTYQVTLTVTDDGGSTATRSAQVTVTAPPPPSTALAQDSFNRTTAGGLGAAGVGGTWTTSGTASSFSTDGARARLRSAAAGANLNAYLTGVSSSDTEVRVITSIGQASTGGGTFVSVVGRRVGAADYRARVVVNSTNQVNLQLQQSGATLQNVRVAGLTYATGDDLAVRLQVTGTSPTTIRAKVWRVGSAEPTSWQVTATDTTAALQTAGHVGVGSYVSGSSAVPLVTSFEDFWAGATSSTPPTPPANVAPTAAFTSAASGLQVSFDGTGSSDSDGSIAGYSWSFGGGATATGPAPSRTFPAAGSYPVTLTVTDNGGATGTVTRTVVVSDTPTPPPPAGFAVDDFDRTTANGWGSATTGGAWSTSSPASNFSAGAGVGSIRSGAAGATSDIYLATTSSAATDLRFTTSVKQQTTGGGLFISGIGRRVGTQDYRARAVINSAGAVNLQLLRSGTTLVAVKVAGLTYATDDNLEMRVQVFGTSPTTIRAKVWKSGTPEPSAWQLTTTDSTAALQSAGSVGVGTYLAGSATIVPLVTTFDSVRATTPE